MRKQPFNADHLIGVGSIVTLLLSCPWEKVDEDVYRFETPSGKKIQVKLGWFRWLEGIDREASITIEETGMVLWEAQMCGDGFTHSYAHHPTNLLYDLVGNKLGETEKAKWQKESLDLWQMIKEVI